MSTNIQGTILDAPSGESIELETDGRVIRPLFSIPSSLVAELRIRFDEDGLQISTVDPSNVAMVELEAPADAFDDYHTTGEVRTGLNLDRFESRISDARLGKRTKDPVSLTIDRTHTRIEITRDYAETTVKRQDAIMNIDPDAIRQSKDLPTIDLDYTASVDVGAFADTIHHFDRGHDHLNLRESDGRMVADAVDRDDDNTITDGSVADFGEIAEPLRDDPTEGVSSVFSISYLKDIVAGLKEGRVDTVTLEWGQEFPLFVEFEREQDGQTLYQGTFALAPRISSD